MTTYYVDGNSGNDSADGSSNTPWKTLGKAAGQVKPSDEVRIRTATYRESVRLRTNNTTWKADTGHTPVIDGNYHDGLFRADGTLPHPESGMGFLPDQTLGNAVTLSGEGVTVDGLTVQNVAGTAFGVSGSRCVVRNCRIDFAYETAIRVGPPSYIDSVVIENNVCTRVSVRWYDPDRSQFAPESVSGVIKMGRTRDGVIRNNICAYGHGEGINIGKASYRTLVEGNIVHTCNHVHLYINRSIDVVLRNNLVYHLYLDDFVGTDGRPPAGIAIGDELGGDGTWPHSAGGQIYNNVVIGLGTLLSVRNNARSYNTQLDNCYIGYNTFIGGDKTFEGIGITGNMQGRPHRASLIENNIIYNAREISKANGDLSAIAFRNNLWGEQPAAAMRGPGDRIGNPNLVNPAAELRSKFPDAASTVDPRNYQLTSHSSLAIARASDGRAINGVTPPAVRKDFYGGNRDAQPDIGAHEYPGVISEVAANFSIGPGQAAGVAPHTVDFTDKSTSAKPIVAWAWAFGDGATSTETNPSHTYTKAGEYDVTLTVTDEAGQTDTLISPAVVAVAEEPTTVIPGAFRRFVLAQIEPRQLLAYGTQYPDLRCVLIWGEEPFHILNFADISDVERSAVQPGASELLWVDTGEEDNPLAGDEDEPVDTLLPEAMPAR